MRPARPIPNAWIDAEPYGVPRHPAPISIRLDGNEGAPPPQSVLEPLHQLTPTSLRQYPDPRPLEAKLAKRFGLEASSVVVTAGGDEGLMRLCRAFLGPGRNLVFPEPSFEMIRRFAEATGASIRSVPYPSTGYPTQAVLDACDDATAVVAVISPNNPTGGVIEADDLRRLSSELPHVMLMVDFAYIEFADDDLTSLALSLPNTVVFRTLSKASGLAGLRLGYAMGSTEWIQVMRAVGLPYPVSTPSLHIASKSLDETAEDADSVRNIRRMRRQLIRTLEEEGIPTYPSQGNFVFARGLNGAWWRDAMAGLGIGIRAWPKDRELGDAIRISCPSQPTDMARLGHAIATIRRPEALLFDMDGVLADVSTSYREAIRMTAKHFGVEVTQQDVDNIKAAGDANNDWVVTWRLLQAAGVDTGIEEVTEIFEGLYQGTNNRTPLYQSEQFLGSRDTLIALKKQYRLGIVTGRPREDAERFLIDFQIQDWFDTVICMEDGPPKPSPIPVRAALSALGVERAWMLGDTPDDVIAAREAGVLPIGVVAPNATGPIHSTLLESGAAIVLSQWDQIKEQLL